MRFYFLITVLSLNCLNLCAQITEDSLETFTAACLDGIDNDGDGLIDCLDPDCLENNVIACLPCYENEFAYADSVEFYIDTCSTMSNLNQDPDKILGAPDFDGFYEGGNFISLGSEGIIQLALIDNLLGNSGNILPDIGIFEKGASREGVMISLRPYDAFTRLMMAYSRADGPDTDGFYFFGSTEGGTEFFDIDSVFTRVFEPNRLLFDGIRLQDIRDFNCEGASPGADIDAICASGRRTEECSNLNDDDEDGFTDSEDIDCGCERDDSVVILSNGNICDASLELSVQEVTNVEYQWYHDGIPVQGADSNVFEPGQIEGNIELAITANGNCTLSEQIALEIPEFMSFVEEKICLSEVLEYNGEILDSTGLYTFNLSSEESCDSIVLLDLEIVEHPPTIIDRQLCEGDSLFFFGQTIRSEGQYSGTLLSSIGCDSTILLNITIEKLLSDTVNITLCDGNSFIYRDSLIDVAGQFSFQFNIPGICDSLILLDVDVLPVSVVDTSLSLCQGDSIELFGDYYSEEGSFSYYEERDSNCTRYDILIDELEAVYFDTLLEICPSDFVILNEELFDDPGQYEQILSSVTGCDSVIRVEVREIMGSSTELDFGLCPGESIMINNNLYSSAGEYTQTLSSVNSCDSTLFITIERLENSLSKLEFELCEGESIDLNGTNYTQGGIYQQVLENSASCDSLINISIIQIDTSVIRREYRLCPGESLFIADSLIESAGQYVLFEEEDSGCLITWMLEVFERDNCERCIYPVLDTGSSHSLLQVQRLEASYFKLDIEFSILSIQKLLDKDEISNFISVYVLYNYIISDTSQTDVDPDFWDMLIHSFDDNPHDDFLLKYRTELAHKFELNSIDFYKIREMSGSVKERIFQLEEGARFVKKAL